VIKVIVYMSSSLNIGIVGLGTVGLGVLKVLKENIELISRRAGKSIDVTSVSAKRKNLDRGLSLTPYLWFDNPHELIYSKNVDVVVELVGGGDGVAREICASALSIGKHVVTANKALMAEHGVELAMMAEENHVQLNYEAAVAGAIPIVKVLREGLVGNHINRVYGILNGTCNYILTQMRDSNRQFQEVLAKAQELGYAESDPTLDVAGIDAAHKLSILSSLAFGTRLSFRSVEVEGINDVEFLDIQFAKELGYGIKLLGIASLNGNKISQFVYPCLVSVNSPINHVEESFNAIVVSGSFSDELILEGKGAGAGPTASAVISDLVDIARGTKVPTFGVNVENLIGLDVDSINDRFGGYYVRFTVVDQPGVLAEITSILRDKEVSIETVVQRGRSPGETVSIVMTLHDTYEHLMRSALQDISKLKFVVEKEKVFRVEKFFG